MSQYSLAFRDGRQRLLVRIAAAFGAVAMVLCLVALQDQRAAAATVNSVPAPSIDDPPVAPETSFDFAVVPDTQNEVAVDGTPQLTSRYQWLSDNKAALNLKFIAHTGDLVNWGVADPVQFTRASAATTVLDNSGVPFAYAIGNHDGAAVKVGGSAAPGNVRDNLRNTTAFNQSFPVSRFAGVQGTFEPNKVDNMYQTFVAGGVNWLVLTHEMWPRESVIQWARGVVSSHPTYNVIVSTHAFTDQSGALQTTGNYGDQNAQVEWNELISQYSNIKFVVSGHYGPDAPPIVNAGYNYSERTGVNGNKVALIMTAYHSYYQNHVRLLHIDTAAGTIGSSVYVSRSTDAAHPTGYITDGASNFVTTGMSWVQPDGGGTTPTVTVPSVPVGVSASAGDGQATVSFSAPANNGGSPVTGYTVTSSPGNIVTTGATSPITMGGLTNGTTYTFSVTAANAAGSSPPSAASTAVTPQASGAATELLPDPGFEAGVGGWKAFNVGTFTSVSTPVHGGSSALKVTAPTAAANLVGLTQNAAIPKSISGKTYTAQCWVNPSSAGLNMSIRLLQYAQDFSTNTKLGTTTIATLPANTWTLIRVSGVATLAGYRIVPQVYSSNQTSNTGTVTYDDCSTSLPSDVVATAPGAPTSVSAVGEDAQATVSFTPPVGTGGSAITGYTVTSIPDGVTVSGSASPITLGGLANGTAYTFTVRATNAIGTGAASAPSNIVIPASVHTAPSAPLGVTAVAGGGQATVGFSAPALDGGSPITAYTVTSSPGGFSATGTTTPITVSGLTNGIAYVFTVKATNALGTGAASSPSASVTPVSTATPPTVPGAPGSVTATAGDTLASVSFTAPVSDGGSAITGYTVMSSPGGLSATGLASPITVPGLANGTAYTFTVTAVNIVGAGSPSTASDPVTPTAIVTVPSAPRSVAATAGDAQATVSFVAPLSDGGASVSSYTVVSSPGGLTASGISSPITVGGLTNGTTYTFMVTATNAVGPGPASAPSAPVTPAAATTAPSAPGTVSAIAGDGQAIVSFSVPTSTGSSPVTGYVVASNPGNLTATGPSSPLKVSGLTNGTAYTFTVRALNAVGSSVPSTASASVVPQSLPSAIELLPDPGFEAGVGGWKAFNVGTLTTVTSPVHAGTKALKVAAVAGPANLVGLTQNTAITKSVSGTSYTSQCWVNASGAGVNMTIRLLQYSQDFGSNTKLNTTVVGSLPANTWTLVKVTGVATVGSYRIVPQVYSSNETTSTGSITYDDCSVTSN